MTKEKETIAAVRAALESGSVTGTPEPCETMMEMRTHLSRTAANRSFRIAIVDVDRDSEQLLHELSKVIASYPKTRFIVISKDFNERLALHAMQAGTRHFLRKSSLSAELDRLIENLIMDGPEGSSQLGHIISVFSCSGGCGATTAAINIANELYLAKAGRVLILDMDYHYGAVAWYLGVAGRYGLADILNREGAIDGHLIESVAVPYHEGIGVLLSPASTKMPTSRPINHDRLLLALESCRESYDYLVIDAPRVPQQVMADLASVSRVAVVVFQLMVKDVGYAKSMISFLADQGISRDRVLPLANRVPRYRPVLKLADSQRALGTDSLCLIRSNCAKAMKSANRGQPLSNVARMSGLRRDYRSLASRIRKCTSNGNH